MERCSSTCTFHVHGDPTMVMSGCGECVFHARCVASISFCERCCLPVGKVDRTVLSVCNVRRCTAAGGVLCPPCAADLVARFERHLSRMGRLTAASARGWLTSFGNLRDAGRPAVVTAVFEALAAACSRGFEVEIDDSGAASHFTERLAALARSHLKGPTTYEALVALNPDLPPEAAVLVRRFVAETRRHFQENPRTREVMLSSAARRPSRGAPYEAPAFMVSDPGTLVGASEEGAAALARGGDTDSMHTLGRDIFYFTSRYQPKSSRESRKREAEWLALLS